MYAGLAADARALISSPIERENTSNQSGIVSDSSAIRRKRLGLIANSARIVAPNADGLRSFSNMSDHHLSLTRLQEKHIEHFVLDIIGC